jgi:hypothetical protein
VLLGAGAGAQREQHSVGCFVRPRIAHQEASCTADGLQVSCTKFFPQSRKPCVIVSMSFTRRRSVSELRATPTGPRLGESPINTAERQAGLFAPPRSLFLSISILDDRRFVAFRRRILVFGFGRRLRALRGRAGGRPTTPALSKVRSRCLSRSMFLGIIFSLLSALR